MESWWDFGNSSGYRGDDLATYRISCPFCLQNGNFAKTHHEERTNANGKTLNYDILRCENCGNLTMAFWAVGDGGLHDWKTVPWPLRYDRHPESWPKDVGRFWIQAKQSQLAKSLDSAAVMARSALQLALRHAGAKGQTLFKDIDQLSENGALPPLMKDWAHEVRLLANDSAHPEPGDLPPTSKDVEDILRFLGFMLEYLFELPSRIESYRGRKEK
jgi:hypothetical protein